MTHFRSDFKERGFMFLKTNFVQFLLYSFTENGPYVLATETNMHLAIRNPVYECYALRNVKTKLPLTIFAVF